MSNAGSTGSFFSGSTYGDGANSTSGANTRTHYTDPRGFGTQPTGKKRKKKKTERARSFFAKG